MGTDSGELPVLGKLPFECCLLSEEATEELGVLLARELLQASRASMVLLEGEMGSGKTAFARGLGRGLGVPGTVNSPTFNLLNEHSGLHGDLFHYDLYRLSGEAAVVETGFWELWQETPGRPRVHAVEWWRRAGTALPVLKKSVLVRISYDDRIEDAPRFIRLEDVDLPHH